MECSICDKHFSASGKEFTEQTLQQHIKDAHKNKCSPRKEKISFPLTDEIATDDMSDGVYFALAWEMGEL